MHTVWGFKLSIKTKNKKKKKKKLKKKKKKKEKTATEFIHTTHNTQITSVSVVYSLLDINVVNWMVFVCS